MTYPWDCLDNETSSYVYMVMLGLMLLVGMVRTWTLSRITMNSSVRLHDRMYAAVVRAPIRFCDTNPKGRHSDDSLNSTEELGLHVELCAICVFVIDLYEVQFTQCLNVVFLCR